MSKPPARVKVESVRPRALSIEDAATYMGIAKKTLYNRLGPRSVNPLPIRVYRFGGKPLLDLVDIDRFMDSLDSEPSGRPAKLSKKPIGGALVNGESRNAGNER